MTLRFVLRLLGVDVNTNVSVTPVHHVTPIHSQALLTFSQINPFGDNKHA